MDTASAVTDDTYSRVLADLTGRRDDAIQSRDRYLELAEQDRANAARWDATADGLNRMIRALPGG